MGGITRLTAVDEQSSKRIAFTILDPDNTPVSVSAIQTATLTLYDFETGANWDGSSPRPGIINNRDAQDILNDNNVTLSDAVTVGRVTWNIQPDDNIIVTPRRQTERHRALFLFTWADGEFRKEFEQPVNNLRGQQD